MRSASRRACCQSLRWRARMGSERGQERWSLRPSPRLHWNACGVTCRPSGVAMSATVITRRRSRIWLSRASWAPVKPKDVKRSIRHVLSSWRSGRSGTSARSAMPWVWTQAQAESNQEGVEQPECWSKSEVPILIETLASMMRALQDWCGRDPVWLLDTSSCRSVETCARP